MNDRAVSLLEQYDVEVYKTRKGRGAFLCETSLGNLIFKEYFGNEEHLLFQKDLLDHLKEQKDIRTEELIPNKEGELCVKDYDGSRYILKTYADGPECNINDYEECLESVRLLARLHSHMELDLDEEKPYGTYFFSPAAEYEKRNKELKKVRKYLKQRSQKTYFEIYLMQNCDPFLEQAYALSEEWQAYEKLRAKNNTVCHGDYQYHNLLRTQGGWFVINFEKCVADDPVRDLYLLMRKLLEKSNWSVSLGKDLLAAYETMRPLSAMSKIDLYYRLAYPEKFWKVVNFYYNSGKAWIPGRNLEKLQKVVDQEKNKQILLDTLFRNTLT